MEVQGVEAGDPPVPDTHSGAQPRSRTPQRKAPPDLVSQGQGVLSGVADGARTRDTQDHNLVLYQLNYSHHYRVKQHMQC